MPVLLRYLMSWLAGLMWQRLRGRSPLPPIRLPRQPAAFSPWQALIAVWLLHKLWAQFGSQAKQQAQQQTKQRVKQRVKRQVKNAGRSASQRFDAWLYAPPRAANKPRAGAPAQPATPAPPTAASAPAPAPPVHETQRLGDSSYA